MKSVLLVLRYSLVDIVKFIANSAQLNLHSNTRMCKYDVLYWQNNNTGIMHTHSLVNQHYINIVHIVVLLLRLQKWICLPWINIINISSAETNNLTRVANYITRLKQIILKNSQVGITPNIAAMEEKLTD